MAGNRSTHLRINSLESRAAAKAAASAAARDALAACAGADRIAEQAWNAVGVDDERLFSLLEERERMLSGLADHITTLKLQRHSADGGKVAASERVLDETDAVVGQVCEALSASQRTTMALAMRVAERVAELREELASVQRAGSAGLGYATLGTAPHVDRVR